MSYDSSCWSDEKKPLGEGGGPFGSGEGWIETTPTVCRVELELDRPRFFLTACTDTRGQPRMTSKGAEEMQNDTIGVDVLKDHLDARRLADGASRRFANEKCGRKAFVKRIAETPVERVGFEPTGLPIIARSGAAGVPFVKVNSRQAAVSPRRSASWRRTTAWMQRRFRAWAPCLSSRRGRSAA